jgi:D-3-phosphoglycerate dehydrogenase
VPLAAKLGKLAVALKGDDVRKITIEVYGELAEYDTRLLTVAALNGAFQGTTDQPVNYVNAPVVAADRGIEVVEEKRRSARDYTNLIAVSADGARVAGTTIGKDARHFLVSALGFEIEMELAPRMALLLYDDIPGVIGRIGNLFGAAEVNIANMTVSRNREGGKALMALSIDSPAPPELQEQLREGMDESYLIG